MKDLEVQVLLDAEVQVAKHTAHKDKNHQQLGANHIFFPYSATDQY